LSLVAPEFRPTLRDEIQRLRPRWRMPVTVLLILIAVAAVLLWELRDRRLRAIEDVGPLLGLPLIGVLPGPKLRRLSGRNHPTLMQQRMVGRLAAPGKEA